MGLYDLRNCGGHIIVRAGDSASSVLNSLFERDAIAVDNSGGFGEGLVCNKNGDLFLIPECTGKTLKSGRTRYTFWQVTEKLAKEIGFNEENITPAKLEQGVIWRKSKSNAIVNGVGSQYKEVMEMIERRRNHDN